MEITRGCQKSCLCFPSLLLQTLSSSYLLYGCMDVYGWALSCRLIIFDSFTGLFFRLIGSHHYKASYSKLVQQLINHEEKNQHESILMNHKTYLIVLASWKLYLEYFGWWRSLVMPFCARFLWFLSKVAHPHLVTEHCSLKDRFSHQLKGYRCLADTETLCTLLSNDNIWDSPGRNFLEKYVFLDNSFNTFF
jgi:hypothetical protein